MSALSRVLWTLTGGILAVAASLLVHRLLGYDPIFAGLVGIIAFLIYLQLLAAVDWRVERRALEHRMMALHADYQDAVTAVEDTRQDIQTLRREAAQGGKLSSSELIAELRVLQTLLSQVAQKSASPMKASPTLSDRLHHTASAHALDHGVVKGEKIPPAFGAAATPDTERREILGVMHHALEENRIDLYLQPIVRLPSRKVAHYEAFSRVRDDKGQIIFPRQFLPVAEESGLVGTLDNLLLFRCIQVIRRLGPRRPGVRFFCNISSRSLDDEDFFPQFVDFMSNNADLNDRLTFEFAQDDVRRHSNEVARGLATLGRQGFRFSMDQVRDLDIDAQSLALRHFSFVKIAAEAFRTAQGSIHRADLKGILARHDMELIVDKIEEEGAVIDILEDGVELGQGYLFGEPRPSRDSAAAAMADDERDEP